MGTEWEPNGNQMASEWEPISGVVPWSSTFLASWPFTAGRRWDVETVIGAGPSGGMSFQWKGFELPSHRQTSNPKKWLTHARNDEKVAAIHHHSAREWTRRVQQNQPSSQPEFLHTHQRLFFQPKYWRKKEIQKEKKNTKRTKLDKLNQTNQYWFMGLAWLVASSLYPTAFNLLNRTTTRLSDSLSKSTIIQRLTLFRFEMI